MIVGCRVCHDKILCNDCRKLEKNMHNSMVTMSLAKWMKSLVQERDARPFVLDERSTSVIMKWNEFGGRMDNGDSFSGG